MDKIVKWQNLKKICSEVRDRWKQFGIDVKGITDEVLYNVRVEELAKSPKEKQ